MSGARSVSTVSFAVDPISELTLPAGCEIKERDIVTDEDVLIGGQSSVEFGVRGRNVIAGERVRIGGSIEATGDCRLDLWSTVAGDVLVEQDAYLGERVSIDGQLVVNGDLDIGDDVQIADGFEANGWIVIRNPMPTVVFLFAYLTQLLRVGEEDAAAELLDEVMEDESETDQPVCIPRSATVTDDAWRVSTPADIGDGCRLHGNLRADVIEIGEGCNLFGSVRARNDIVIGPATRIHGDVTSKRGDVELGDDVEILGDVDCRDLAIGDRATVDGRIRANGEITMPGPDRTPEG